ncbi:MAG: DUF962 domain-containing protein [Candidatus Melainabacteria bacterium]|nr:MAG: DUF962 domain-containing protein [Candidatus Melainabacteria bacterium]
MEKKRFKSFSEFYPFYLSEHQDRVNRRLHFVGSTLVIALVLFALFTQQWLWLAAVPLAGYGFAWFGHFFFEKNKPATFNHPIYSLMGDWVMYKDILTGKVKL